MTMPSDVNLRFPVSSQRECRVEMLRRARILAPVLEGLHRDMLSVFNEDVCWPELWELVETARTQLDVTIKTANEIQWETKRILG